MSQDILSIDKGEQLKPTTPQQLNLYSQGIVIELPSFSEGQPFIARMTRPSIMYLAKTGQIPNALLSKAGEMFAEGSKAFKDDNGGMLNEVYDIMYAIAGASLMKPTLAEIESAGVQLTDEQLMFIFNYSQNGIKALEQFRRQREVLEHHHNSEQVLSEA